VDQALVWLQSFKMSCEKFPQNKIFKIELWCTDDVDVDIFKIFPDVKIRFQTEVKVEDNGLADKVRMCTVIEGKGDLFKPRMAMFKEWLDEGLIWVRDESTDHIRIVIGRSNNIRKISEDDIFEMGKRVTIFQRGYRILFYDNDEKIE
jgi:hypothetical protein